MHDHGQLVHELQVAVGGQSLHAVVFPVVVEKVLYFSDHFFLERVAIVEPAQQ